MPPTIILSLLKSLGVNPDDLKAQASAAFALVQSIDARLNLIAAQNELILRALGVETVSAPPKKLANGKAATTETRQ
jgi:hypothetical protein